MIGRQSGGHRLCWRQSRFGPLWAFHQTKLALVTVRCFILGLARSSSFAVIYIIYKFHHEHLAILNGDTKHPLSDNVLFFPDDHAEMRDLCIEIKDPFYLVCIPSGTTMILYVKAWSVNVVSRFNILAELRRFVYKTKMLI